MVLRVLVVGALGLMGVVACVKPVVRQDPQLVVKGANKPKEEAKVEKYSIPDLSKRLWVLPFTKSYATDADLERFSIPAILQVEIFGEIRKKNNPFLLPTEDQRTLKGIGITSDTDTEELVRIARGSSIAGFLRGDIVEVNVAEEEEAEGVLRTRRVTLTIKANYQLYDAVSGQKIHEGTVSTNHSETRSDVLRMTQKLSQPRKKLGIVSQKAAQEIVASLNPMAGKLGWSGKILKIESNRIFLNSGRRTGIRVGDVLKVLERSRPIYDPDDGYAVGFAPGRLKGTVKVVQYFGLDGSIAILQSGGGVFPGDEIELY